MPYPTLAANSTWFSQGGTSVTRASITEIEVVDTYTATGNEIDSWDASAAKDGSIMVYVEGTKLTIAGNGTGKIYANPNSSYAFSYSGSNRFTALTTISGAELLDTSKATSFERLFYLCKKLESVDVSSWNTANVVNMNGVFNQAYVLKSAAVENWDTSSVTDMSYMFQLAMGLSTLDVSNWDVSNVTLMRGMFQGHTSVGAMNLVSIGDVSNWDTSACTDMYGMFNYCSVLETLDVSNWNVSKVTTMFRMFAECNSLKTIGNPSNWDVGLVTIFEGMFRGCSSLSKLDVSNWGTGSATNMNSMFAGCTALETLDVSNWGVSKVTTFCNMFSCGNNYGTTPMKIQELDVSNWNTSSATDMSFMFYGCKGPGSVDVSNWDVSKVTTFDHMFAHSYLTIGNISGWTNTIVENLECTFHSVQNAVLDVSGFRTGNCISFGGMFKQYGSNLTDIIGLENFDTAAGVEFGDMFYGCSEIKVLDLSSFNTKNAKDGVVSSANGTTSATLGNMFYGMTALEKIILGSNFSFNGDGTTTSNIAVLPTPSSEYIDGADGNWHKADGTECAARDVPTNTFGVYYASTKIFDRCLVVKYGSIARLADAVRVAVGGNRTYDISEMIKALLEVH